MIYRSYIDLNVLITLTCFFSRDLVCQISFTSQISPPKSNHTVVKILTANLKPKLRNTEDQQ